jgi:hypothetical protein
MKWLLLWAVFFLVMVGLLSTIDPADFDPLGPPSTGGVSLPLALVAVLFVIVVGVWKLLNR